MKDKDFNLKHLLRTSAAETPSTGESVKDKLTEEQRKLFDEINEGYTKAGELCGSKVKIAERALAMV